jgi:VWFA-related protein
MHRTLSILAATLFAVTALAQPGTVVSFPVSVVTAAGSPVRGLTAANFSLYDEKKKQSITSFDVVDYTSNASAGATAPMNPAARRSFVLLFDLGFTSPRSLVRAQDAARRIVNEIAGPRDLIAVATVHFDRGFRFVTALTTDRQLVAAAISNPAAFRSSDPLRLGGESSVTETPDAAPVATTDSRQRTEREVDSISNLAGAMRMLPGRKQVILFSDGFDAHLLQSTDVAASKAQVIDRMADSFRAADVVLNAVDIQDKTAAGAAINANASLFMLVRPTGGEVFPFTNELRTDFVRSLRQQEVIYVLGFRPTESSPGLLHNVSVRLINTPAGAPNGARVVQGAGYFERGRETSIERALNNAQIIVNDVPQRDLRLNVLAAAFPPAASGKLAQVPVIIDINGSDLIRETSATIGGADVFVYAFDNNGVVRDRLFDSLTVEIAKSGEKVRTTGVRYYGTLMLPPGSYAIKSFVRTGDPDRGRTEATEKRGYARANVTVPAEGQIAILPPIPIDEDGKWLTVRSSRNAVGDYPFEYGGRTFLPTAALDMTGGPRKVALFIFGAHRNEITFETRPKTKVLGATETNGVTKVVLQLDNAAGAAALDITVFKKGIAAGQHTSVPLM